MAKKNSAPKKVALPKPGQEKIVKGKGPVRIAPKPGGKGKS